MNITLPDPEMKAVQDNNSFTWLTPAIKYLGIWLTPRLSSIFSRNFTPLLKSTESDLRAWNPGQFSWLGSSAIGKMTVLPKVLYSLCTLPI